MRRGTNKKTMRETLKIGKENKSREEETIKREYD